jgi:hypothetical protein
MVEEPIVSIFTVDQNLKDSGSMFFHNVGKDYQTTQRHVPEGSVFIVTDIGISNLMLLLRFYF